MLYLYSNLVCSILYICNMQWQSACNSCALTYNIPMVILLCPSPIESVVDASVSLLSFML